MTRVVMLAAVAVFSVPTDAASQTRPDERFFVNINVVHHSPVSWWAEDVFQAGQSAYEISHELQGGAARDVRAVIDTTLPTGVTPQTRDSWARARERGNVVSVTVLSAGIRLVSRLSAGVALSRWATTSDVSVAIHDQNDFSTLFLDIGQRRSDHGQVAFHFPVAWTVQVADRFDIAILGGPSLFRVTHSPVIGIEAAGIDAFGDPDVLVSTQPTRETGSGYHYGFDITVRWNEWMGLGLLLRSTSGSLPRPAGRPTTQWYASELCLGFRFRF